MKIHGITDPGRLRPRNEDRLLIREFGPDTALIAVLDGMGGQEGGELAAELSSEVLAAFRPGAEPAATALAGLVREANRVVLAAEEAVPERYGMGCTLTVALIENGRVSWTHVGDSRLYHYHTGRLQQVSTDHNMAHFLYLEGNLTLEEARQSPFQSLLDQGIGGSFIEAESGELRLAAGDLLLLSSDGLHDELAGETIAAILAQGGDPATMTTGLLEAALAAGGRDNITVVILAA